MATTQRSPPRPGSKVELVAPPHIYVLAGINGTGKSNLSSSPVRKLRGHYYTPTKLPADSWAERALIGEVIGDPHGYWLPSRSSPESQRKSRPVQAQVASA